MTLLGVVHGAGRYSWWYNYYLGGIGTGYIYADWNGQIAYTTPNMNGLSLTLGLMQPWNATASGAVSEHLRIY